MNFCPQCGAPAGTGSFCSGCGGALTTAAAAVPPPSAAASKICRYCKSEVPKDAVRCRNCAKDIGPGSGIAEAGKKMQGCGCLLTLLITIPFLLILFFSTR